MSENSRRFGAECICSCLCFWLASYFSIHYHLPYRLKLKIIWGRGNIFCSICAVPGTVWCWSMAVAWTLHRCKIRLIKAAESTEFFFFFFSSSWNKLYIECTSPRVWVLKDISLQKQESSVSARGSGSIALLFIVAISLEMGISSLTHHCVLNSTECKINIVPARKYVPRYLLV